MTQRVNRGRLGWRGAVFLGLALAGLAAWIFVSRRSRELAPAADEAPSVLRYIPPGAMLVALIDVAALRGTPMGEALLGQGRSVAGLGEVQDICGMDPMASVDQVAVAIPDAGEDAGFGLFAMGRFDAGQLLGCAEKIVQKRGGRPVRVPSGAFTVLRDASLELSSAELAAADGGPLILAEPSYIRAAIGTTGAESVHSDPAHASLRGLVPRGQVTATVVLSAEQRRALLDELRAHGHTESPLRGIVGGALSVRLGATFDVHAAVRCEDTASCQALADQIRSSARSEARTTVAQAIGLGPVLEGLVVEPRADFVRLSISMPAEEALALMRRALALRELASPDALPEEDDERPEREAPPDAGAREEVPEDAGVRIEVSPSARPKP